MTATPPDDDAGSRARTLDAATALPTRPPYPDEEASSTVADPRSGPTLGAASGVDVLDDEAASEAAVRARRAARLEAAALVDWRLHPVRWLEARSGRRWLPGAWYAVAVWALWRVIHEVVTVVAGGDAVKTAYNYDGERYLQILRFGYENYRAEMPNTAFFPGISWLAWPIYQVTHSTALTVHLTATITGIAAFVTVWGVSKAWKDERVARNAVWLLALMPSSLYLWQFYSEGLFIALGAGGVWADRRGKRWIATLCFAGIATTRTVGILVPAVVVLVRIIRQRRIDRWAVTYALAPLVALVPVLFMMKHYTGDWLAFLRVQNDWGRSLSLPWTTVRQGFDNLWPTPETIMVPARIARNFDLYSVVIVSVAVGYSALSRKDRWPLETPLLGVALILLPLCSTSLASFNRFALATWIIYPVWASLLRRLPVWGRRGAWAAIVVALTVTSYHMAERLAVQRFVG